MASDTGLSALGAALPVLGPDPVATLRDEASPLLPGTPPAPAAAAERTELSVTGKLLAALLQTSSPPAALTHAAPLMPAPTPEPAAIAEAIRNGIEHSGLFYESHLAEWVSGQRDADALTQEPQSRADAADEVPVIVRQQLELLDSQPVPWRGELWPGLPLQLQIDRQAPDTRRDADEAAPAAWSTTLVSEFPALGSVVAKLRIDGDRLQLKLHARDSASALLAGRSAELRDSLTAAGLQLQRFDTDHDQAA